jgi:hypothetical protein
MVENGTILVPKRKKFDIFTFFALRWKTATQGMNNKIVLFALLTVRQAARGYWGNLP